MTRNVIRWNEEEREKLLQEVFKLHDSWPHYSALELVRRAQKIVLPFDRRREITGTQQVDWVQKKLDKRIQQRSVTSEQTTEVSLPKKPELKELLIELLVELGTDILKEVIVGVKANLIEQQFPTFFPDTGYVQPNSSTHLRKIAIYGLIPSQVQTVRQQFKDCFDLRFLKDVSPKQLVAGAERSEHTILMTKFISHDYDAIKKYKNIVYCNGGVTELTRMLEEMYLEE